MNVSSDKQKPPQLFSLGGLRGCLPCLRGHINSFLTPELLPGFQNLQELLIHQFFGHEVVWHLPPLLLDILGLKR